MSQRTHSLFKMTVHETDKGMIMELEDFVTGKCLTLNDVDIKGGNNGELRWVRLQEFINSYKTPFRNETLFNG